MLVLFDVELRVADLASAGDADVLLDVGGEGLTLGSSVKNLGELLSPRGVLSPFRVEEEEDEAPRGFVYDPRLLIFEFVSTLLLREEQVRLVEKFLDAS